jgi:hypothetical protein
MKELGEDIECHYADKVQGSHTLAAPVTPIHNVYLPHLLPLTQVKLRIGHAIARNAARLANARYVKISTRGHQIFWGFLSK